MSSNEFGPAIPPLPQQPPPTQRRTRARRIIAAAACALALIAATATVTTLIVRDDDSDSSTDSAPAAVTPDPADAEPAVTEETGDPEVYNTVPEPDEFTLTLKTVGKKCYGYGVGCNVTVRPDLSYAGAVDLDPDANYSITYEVKGGEEGPVIETMELDGDGELTYSEVLVQTPGSGTKVTAEITDVEYNEYGY